MGNRSRFQKGGRKLRQRGSLWRFCVRPCPLRELMLAERKARREAGRKALAELTLEKMGFTVGPNGEAFVSYSMPVQEPRPFFKSEIES